MFLRKTAIPALRHLSFPVLNRESFFPKADYRVKPDNDTLLADNDTLLADNGTPLDR